MPADGHQPLLPIQSGIESWVPESTEGNVKTASDWNVRYPVGTPVRYFPVKGRLEYEETKTRSEVWTLASGQAVVLLEGKTGGRWLECIESMLP